MRTRAACRQRMARMRCDIYMFCHIYDAARYVSAVVALLITCTPISNRRISGLGAENPECNGSRSAQTLLYG
eukprot:COSAG02_NODE_64_length_43111_cov_35.627709_43_plen_71_part_01